MKLLIVTDHKFTPKEEKVFDNYCFDYAFFKDYIEVFDSVHVYARKKIFESTVDYSLSSGTGLNFSFALNNGLIHLLLKDFFKHRDLENLIKSTDAVCLRIPSILSINAYTLAIKYNKPIMFEMIGDPIEALKSSQHNKLNKFIFNAVGKKLAYVCTKITSNAVAGSYVSNEHLQRKYPTRNSVKTEAISSIRLPDVAIKAPKQDFFINGCMKIILVGSLMPVKCHDVLINAVALAIHHGCKIELNIVGHGPSKAYLNELVHKLNLNDHVIFHGHVSGRKNIDNLLDSCDLFAMTSSSEGMPRAMIEAMARGLPAIGTNVGGISELLQEDQLVNVFDHIALSNKIILLYNDVSKLKEYALRSNVVAKQFTNSILKQKRRNILLTLRNSVI